MFVISGKNWTMTNIPQLTERNFLKLVKSGPSFLKKLKRVDPTDRFVVLFPDSKNVRVGIGFNLLGSPAAEKTFIEANKFLDRDLFKLCLDGPKIELEDSLVNRHLAAYVSSHATMARLAETEPDTVRFCKTAGGLGVGLVNSLVFSGAMSYINGLDLVNRYAQAMEAAAKIIPASKIAVKLKPATNKSKICRAGAEYCIKKGVPPEIAVCSIVEYIKPQLLVIGGHKLAIEFLKTDGQRLFDYKLLVDQPKDQNAYNTELMRPAADFIKGYLGQRISEDPDYLREPESCSVYSSTLGKRLRKCDTIRKDLELHPVSPIKTEQLLHTLFSRRDTIAQPNILVIWDRSLMTTLGLVNRKARSSAKLLEA